MHIITQDHVLINRVFPIFLWSALNYVFPQIYIDKYGDSTIVSYRTVAIGSWLGYRISQCTEIILLSANQVWNYADIDSLRIYIRYPNKSLQESKSLRATSTTEMEVKQSKKKKSLLQTASYTLFVMNQQTSWQKLMIGRNSVCYVLFEFSNNSLKQHTNEHIHWTHEDTLAFLPLQKSFWNQIIKKGFAEKEFFSCWRTSLTASRDPEMHVMRHDLSSMLHVLAFKRTLRTTDYKRSKQAAHSILRSGAFRIRTHVLTLKFLLLL